MIEPPGAAYRIEPLTSSHDRVSFHCGVPELDHYLHVQAGQDARRKAAAPFVMLDAHGQVVGYYTLSAYSVHFAELPEIAAKKLPRYPLLPATLLGRLAVRADHKGQKLGKLLLMDALWRSLRNTDQIASIGVIVEAIDDNARAFYLHHEFTPLENHANKLFLAMATIEKAFKAG